MANDRFRHQLAKEARQWVTDGLIQPDQFDRLADRYQFRDLDRSARNRFVGILFALGAVLLGLGAIVFVSANWQVWSREGKLAILLGSLLGINTLGFYLWRSPRQRLAGQGFFGQMCLLLGGLLLGANLALTAQMFHQGGPLSTLYLVWGGGVVAMAIGLRLVSLGVLGVVLIASAYLTGLYDWQIPDDSWMRAVIEHVPILSALAFWPLAHTTRSRLLFGMAWVLTLGSLQTNLWWSYMHPWVASVLTLAVPFGLGWGYRDRLWPALQHWWLRLPLPSVIHHWLVPGGAIDPRPLGFQTITQTLTLLWLMGTFYVISFWGFWQDAARPYDPADFVSWTAIDVAVAAVAVVLMVARGRSAMADRTGRSITEPVLWVMVLSLGLTLGWHYNINPIPLVGTFLGNVLLFLLGLGLIREGLGHSQRVAFWSGVLLWVLDIFTRMVEYDTALILKALVFALAGVGTIGAGFWFERSIKSFAPADRQSTARF
ncbi:MAG: DUF2157 domain-containing protein [Oscillatoriales cyanobacterium]|nr:MAG: DUF2157 domain-containing protein [Oscillatoriales cyanobacterium]